MPVRLSPFSFFSKIEKGVTAVAASRDIDTTMGMVGGLTQLTPEELERVRRDPKLLPRLESEIAEADASRVCELDKAWHGVHFLLVGDAGTKARRWVLPLYLAISAGVFIATAMLERILVVSGGEAASSGLLFRILRSVGIVSFAMGGVIVLFWLQMNGVRWLRMVFSRKRTLKHAFVPPDAVRKALLGGTWLGPIDDTSTHYATAEEVRALAPFLAALTDEEIRRRFDPARMRTLGIYLFSGSGHDGEAWFEYMLDDVHRAIACYQDAAKRGNAVVFSAG